VRKWSCCCCEEEEEEEEKEEDAAYDAFTAGGRFNDSLNSPFESSSTVPIMGTSTAFSSRKRRRRGFFFIVVLRTSGASS
jgi:hypothetical protein